MDLKKNKKEIVQSRLKQSAAKFWGYQESEWQVRTTSPKQIELECMNSTYAAPSTVTMQGALEISDGKLVFEAGCLVIGD